MPTELLAANQPYLQIPSRYTFTVTQKCVGKIDKTIYKFQIIAKETGDGMRPQEILSAQMTSEHGLVVVARACDEVAIGIRCGQGSGETGSRMWHLVREGSDPGRVDGVSIVARPGEELHVHLLVLSRQLDDPKVISFIIDQRGQAIRRVDSVATDDKFESYGPWNFYFRDLQ